VSDLHVGSQLFKEHLFQKYVVQPLIDNDDLYAVLNGDLIEGITNGDKRFNRKAVDKSFDSPQEEAEYVIELLKPVPKGKLLGGCLGNHEITNAATFDAFRMISRDLDIPYGAGIYKLIVTNNNKVVHKHLMCHGKWTLPKGAKDPIQREANRKAAQKRLLESLGHSDCITASCGHHHALLVVNPTVTDHLYLTDDGSKIKAKFRVSSNQKAEYIPSESRWFIGSGAYRGNLADPGSGAIDYAELFEPASLGHAMIHAVDGEVVKVEEVTAN